MIMSMLLVLLSLLTGIFIGMFLIPLVKSQRAFTRLLQQVSKYLKITVFWFRLSFLPYLYIIVIFLIIITFVLVLSNI